ALRTPLACGVERGRRRYSGRRAGARIPRALRLDDALSRGSPCGLRPRGDPGRLVAPVAGLATADARGAGTRVRPAGRIDDRLRAATGLPELRCALRAPQSGPVSRAGRAALALRTREPRADAGSLRRPGGPGPSSAARA